MDELTDSQFLDHLRRRYRAEGRFSRAVHALGWDYKQAYWRTIRLGAGPEFAIGFSRIKREEAPV